MKSQLFAAAASVAVMLAGAAQAAPEVEIKNAVARVVVVPEARSDVEVTVTPGRGPLPKLDVTRTGSGKVVIDGGLEHNRIRNCTRHGHHDDDGFFSPTQPPADVEIEVRDLGKVKLADAPLITIKTPKDVDVRAGGAVWGAIDRSDSLELGSAGCGDWTVGNVAGDMKLNLAGSGDIRAGSARNLEAAIAGSGDIRTAAVGGVVAKIAGSGDVHVRRADGPVKASIAGSGDVVIDEGRTPKLDASIAGSGDVRFGGEAGEIDASILGSGDVRVKAVRGEIHKRVAGSGSVQVGG